MIRDRFIEIMYYYRIFNQNITDNFYVNRAASLPSFALPVFFYSELELYTQFDNNVIEQADECCKLIEKNYICNIENIMTGD
jgi:hypothetical protein